MNTRPGTTANGRLRYERELRGWSQKRVADAVGTSKFMVSRWEGGIMMPSPHFREQLCLLFGKTAEELGFIQPVTGQRESSEPSVFWHFPLRRNPLFTGRTGILEELDALLQDSPVATPTQSYALYGLGGIGKTQIVVEYAYLHAREFAAIFWIGAESVETIIASLLEIAEVLQLPQRQEADQQQAIAAVQHWLITHSGWLLIWDNLEDQQLFQRFLPPTRHGVNLITTRSQAVGTLAQGIEVQTMEPEEGMLLLLRRAKVFAGRLHSEQMSHFAVRLPTDYAAARILVTIMGGLPLALDQAGAYIEEAGCSVSDYLQRYATQRAQLLERRGMLARDHLESIAATFRLASQRLAHDHPVAADLLRVCTQLHAETIPEELFTAGALHLGPVLASLAADPSQLDLAIVALRTLSLVQRHPEAHMFSIHRLVQAVLLEEMSELERQQWQQRAIRMLNTLFPEAVPQAWQQCERLLPHVLACAASISNQTEDQNVAEMLRKAAEYLHERAHYEQAEPLYQRTLHISEQTLGVKHFHVATVLNGLAKLSYEQGKYEQAKALHQRALRIREQALRPEHLLVTTSLDSLAILYEIQGKYEQAEAFHQRSLMLREQILGSEHPDVAASLNNLAILSKIQGKYEVAESLHLRALHIRKQALGPEHPDVAASLSNLAVLYMRIQVKYEQAEAFLQQALHIWEQVLGPEHPKVAFSLNGLADLCTQHAQYDEAEAMYQRAISISERALGPEHPRVAAVLNGLANLYTRQRKYAQAEVVCQRALCISERAFGPEHPEVAHSLHGLADLSSGQSKYEEAEILYQRVLHIREQAVGPEHLDVAPALSGLAHLYRQQGKYEEAEALYQRALAIREQHLGRQHPETARNLATLAALLSQDQGRYMQAEPLLWRACTIFEQQLGQRHPETVQARTDYQALILVPGAYPEP